jgi:adenosylcobinamide-phosphate synthase
VTLLLAYLLDAVIGEPQWLPHPVIAIGRMIAAIEKRLRDISQPPAELLWRGALLVITVVGATWATAVFTVYTAELIHPVAGRLLTVILLATTLAAKSLSQSAAAVYRPLSAGDMPAARQAVSMIVGRDTDSMSASGVARATVETVAENTVDGVTAPLFYALIGGLPLALAYKAVNTLDSMVGYQNDKYLYFGRAAAKLDDAANWLPARLTVPAMLLAAAILRFDARAAWNAVRIDGKNHPSPNSGLSEALTAGALGLTLGGESCYGGRISNRHRLNSGGRLPGHKDIPAASLLMRVTSVIFLAAGLAVRYLLT